MKAFKTPSRFSTENRWLWRGCFVAIIGLCAGCSPSFHYTPAFGKISPAITGSTGLAISTGLDLRPTDQRQPDWAKNAELIVSDALAEEVRHAKLFHRVKTHAGSVNLKKYSEVVRFRIQTFECRNEPAFFEQAGRELLRDRGFHGVLIAASIPSKYVSQVTIEFEVLEASTQRSIFVRTYSATGSITVNGYQGEKPKIKQTSDELEVVLTQFVGDLAKSMIDSN